MAKELTREELEELYAAMVAQGLGQAALDGFRRHHGLPMPERQAPTIVIRTAPAPRPRSRRKSSAPKSSAPTAATSKSRVETRFDLKD